MDPFYLGLLIILLGLSALFSASETAFIALSPAKVRTLQESKKWGASYLVKLKEQAEKTLVTILICNNFLNVAISVITTSLMEEAFGSASLAIITGLLTLIILVFGEIVPKAFATNHSAGIGLLMSAPIYFFVTLLTPLNWIFTVLIRGIGRLFKTSKAHHVTGEEIVAMASIGAEEGSLDENERELIENILEFNDIRVEEIMTPRVHIDAMPEDFSITEATEFVINHSHSRIPVYRQTIDNIVGIISLKNLLEQFHEEEDPDRTLRQVELLKPLRVAHSMRIHQLFLLFKKNRQHMAIVIDQHGGTAGLITMEDLLEEIVGDIEDESDRLEEMVKKLGKNEYEVSGRLELWDLSVLTGLELDYPEHRTVSFLIMENLGDIPKVGSKIKIQNWELQVTKMVRTTIVTVSIKKL